MLSWDVSRLPRLRSERESVNAEKKKNVEAVRRKQASPLFNGFPECNDRSPTFSADAGAVV